MGYLFAGGFGVCKPVACLEALPKQRATARPYPAVGTRAGVALLHRVRAGAARSGNADAAPVGRLADPALYQLGTGVLMRSGAC